MIVLDARTGEVLAVVGGTSYYDPLVGFLNRAVMGGRQVGRASSRSSMPRRSSAASSPTRSSTTRR